MVRWSISLLFLLPLTLGVLLAQPTSWFAPTPPAGFLWWIAIALMVWFYLQRLASLATDGRIFGPGKDAFH